MGYNSSTFEFDLQRFTDPDVAVDLTNAAAAIATGASTENVTKYVHDDGTVNDTVDGAIAKIELVAGGGSKTITVAAAADKTVGISGATQTQLNGVTIKTIANLTAEPSVATGAKTTVIFSAATAGGATTQVTVKGLDSDGEGADTADTTFTVSADGITTAEGAEITCSNGVVLTNNKKKTITVDVAGTTVSKLEDGSNFSVEDSDEDSLATTYVAAVTGEDEDAKTTLTVSGDQIGVYSGYKATQSATELTDIAGTDVGNVKITLADGGKDTVTVYPGGATTSYAALNSFDVDLTLVANTAATAKAYNASTPAVTYYAVTKNGSGYAATAITTEDVAEAVAYFKVTYDPKVNTGADVKVELVSSRGNDASAVLALGKITVDALAVTGVNYNGGSGVAALKTITLGDGLTATSSVTVNNIAKGVTVTADESTTVTKDYAPWYTLTSTEASRTITFSNMTASDGGKYYFFEIVPGAKNTTTGESVCTIVRDTEATHAYSLEGGKVKLSVSGGDANDVQESGFLVTAKSATDEGVTTTTYTVKFYAGAGASAEPPTAPASLSESSWKDLIVTATGITADTETTKTVINIVPDATDGAADKYLVSSIVNDVTVKEGTGDAGTYTDVTIKRSSASSKTTIVIKDGDSNISSAGITLNTSGTTYWVVTRNYEATGTGNPTITIQKLASGTPSSGSSYLTVTNTDGNVTVTYTNGASIALTGLKDATGENDQKITLNPSGLAAGKTLTITDTGALVDYSVTNLARGVTVAGATTSDSIEYDSTDAKIYNNAVSFILSAKPAETTTTYYKIKVDTTASTATGLKTVSLDAAYTATELSSANNGGLPAAADNYFTLVQGADGTYSISYHISTSVTESEKVNLKTGTATGQVTVDASKVTDAASKITLSTKDGSTDVVNGYLVTNVINGGIAAITQDGTDISTGEAVTYKTPVTYALAAQTGENVITLDGTAAKYKVVATTAKGVTTYAITKWAAGDDSTGASYFQTAYDSEKGTVTLSFEQGSAEGAVTQADFAKNVTTGNAVKVSATDLLPSYTTLTLTDDTTNAIAYAVTGVPSTVTTINHGTGTGDSITYAETYQFAEDGNKLALSKTEGTTYYEVTATGGKSARGIYTCTIGSALTTTGDTAAEKEASISAKNYFKVEVGSTGAVTVTYHAAEQPSDGKTTVTSLSLTPAATGVEALVVDVDPTSAAVGTKASPAVFTFGEASGPALTYNVSGLKVGQSAVAATSTNDTVNPVYDVSYAVEYQSSSVSTDLGKITLTLPDGWATTLAAEGASLTQYFAVTAVAGSTTSTTDQGLTTFTVKAVQDIPAADATAPASGAYFMVKYSSPYQVNITYVNPVGESLSLTKAGVPQIIVDTGALASTTFDTINITDATGGNYNGVNYALINAPEAVKGNIIGQTSGDTVSYKEAAVLADGQTISIVPENDVTYYTLKAATANGSTTYQIDSTTATKPQATANYFYVTKNSSGKYTVAYHMSEGGDGYSFSAASLEVDASKIAPGTKETESAGTVTTAAGSVTIDVDATMGNVTTAVTGAVGDVSYGPAGTGTNTISYSTTFAWTPGTYYIPVKTTATAATVKDGVASGATVAGNTDNLYVQVVVTTQTTTDGEGTKTVTYVATPTANVYKSNGSGGAMADSGSTYTMSGLTIELPATVTNFKTTEAVGEITGVKKNDVITATNAVKVTTNELALKDIFTVGSTTFKVGTAGQVTVTGAGKVFSGGLSLTVKDETLTASSDSKVVTLKAVGSSNDGVLVTFAEGKVASISGLNSGESVEYDGFYYTYDSENTNRIIRSNVSNGALTYAAASTGNLLDIKDWSANTAQQVGQALTLDSTSESTAYIAIGTSATSDVTVAKRDTASLSDAVSGTYYVKAKTASGGLSLSVVKANSNLLMEAATDYKGTITVDASTANSSFTYVGNATADGDGNTYKVAFTGVTAGSALKYLDSEDTVVTSDLSGTNVVTVVSKSRNSAGAEVETSIAYKANGSTQKFEFVGSGLKKGVLTLTGDTSTSAAEDLTVAKLSGGATVIYNDGVSTSTAGTAVITVVDGAVTSITDLETTGEKVSIDDGITVTTYERTATNTITKTELTKATSQAVTYTATVTGAAEVLKDITYTAASTIYTNDFAWKDGGVGYFVVDSSSTTGAATIDTITPTVEMKENTAYVKAEVSLKEEGSTDYVLKLSTYTVKNGAFKAENLYNARVKVKAPTSAGTTLTYTASGQTYNVDFEDVTKDSNLKLMSGDTVQTGTLGNGDTITLNNQTVTSKASGTLTLYSTGSGYGAISGTILVDGTISGYVSSAATSAFETLTYTAGTAEGNDDGVIVSFSSGSANSITDLDVGESVKIVSLSETKTYEAITDKIVACTTTNSSGSTTQVKTFADGDTTKDVMAAGTSPDNYVDTVDYKNAFSWTDATADTDGIGYFLVDSDGNATVVDTDKDTVISTYRDVGAGLVKVTYDRTGKGVTITQDTVGATGAPTGITSTKLKELTVTVSGNQQANFTKISGVTMNISGVGKGSTFGSGFVSGDTIATASLTKGDTITFTGTGTYTAGADGKLTFNGAAAYGGTFQLTSAAASLTASVTDSDKVTTKSTVTYTAGTADDALKDGALVKVTSGLVSSVTDLELGESVAITAVVTNKDGSQSEVKTEYTGTSIVESGAQKGMLLVTRKVTKDGAVTESTQVFKADGTADVATSSGWTTKSSTTANVFNFGDSAAVTIGGVQYASTSTGYFRATLDENKTHTDTYGKYVATVAVPTTTDDISLDKSKAGTYLKVTATKDVTGAVTFTDMELMELSSSGTWSASTGKDAYATITAPTSATITLAEHDFPVVINASVKSGSVDSTTFANVGADDVVNLTPSTAGDTLVVNSVAYKSADAATQIIAKGGNGTSSVTQGNLTVNEQSVTAATSGDTVSYDKGTYATGGGVVVAIADGKITSITDLQVGEKATVVSSDGAEVVYTRTGNDSSGKITKTITKDGVESVWEYSFSTSTPQASTNVVNQAYGVSKNFTWPTEAGKSVAAYASLGTVASPTAGEIKAGVTGTITTSDTTSKSLIARAVLTKDSQGEGYTVTSLQILKGTALEDASDAEYNPETVPTPSTSPVYAVNITAPADTSITLADSMWTAGDPQTEGDVVYRNYKVGITNAAAGQTYSGLGDYDTVTTANLSAGDTVTVNKKTYVAATTGGKLVMQGDGTAVSGSFTVNKANSISGSYQTIAATSGEVMVVMSYGAVSKIYQLGNGETITVTNTSTGEVSTYVGKTVSEGIQVTKTTVKDGATSVGTAVIADGGDIFSETYEDSDTGNSVKSKFDWTEAGGAGYFLVTTSTVGETTTGTATIEKQTTQLNITKSDEGKIYAKVTLSDDGAVSNISLQEVQSNGTLAAYTGTLAGTLTIVAPTDAALKLVTTGIGTDASVAVNITGAIKGSGITLGANDTLTTASLNAGETVKVNSQDFYAGGSTVLKFATNANATNVLVSGGIVQLKRYATGNAGTETFYTTGINNASGTTTLDADNATVTYNRTTATYAEVPVITVTNGVVTAISGLTNNGNTVAVTSSDSTVTYTAAVTRDAVDPTIVTDNKLNANVTALATDKDITLAALANGATFAVGGTTYTSGAANNVITLVNESSAATAPATNYTIKNGVVRLTNTAASITATGSSTAATDNVLVTKTGTAGDAYVTVQNGQVASVTGVSTGDRVTVTQYSSTTSGATTTYSCTVTSYTVASGQVTKLVKTGTSTTSLSEAYTNASNVSDEDAVKTTAYVSGASDLLTANYFSSTDTTESLVGQFSWTSNDGESGISGRQTGYFKLATKKTSTSTTYTGTIAEQATEQGVTPVKNDEVRYAVANIENSVLTISGLHVTNTTSGSSSVTEMEPIAASDSTFAGSMLTITAPTDTAITYDKGTGTDSAAQFGVTINKLAAGSTISNLDTGDKIVTNTLEIGEAVKVDSATYVTGAKGTLTIVGEGESSATTPTNKTALLAGTVKLGSTVLDSDAAAVTSVVLSGAAQNSDSDSTTNTANDLTVTHTGSDEVIVKAANGIVTSITGLTTQGQTVTVSDGTNLVTYEVLDTEGTMIGRYESLVASPTTYTAKSYKTVAAGKEIYSAADAKNGYVAAPGTAFSNLSFSATGTTTGYFKLATADMDENNVISTDASTANMVTAANVTTLGDSVNAMDSSKFDATPENYYLKVTTSTAASGVVTVKSVDLMKAGATGALTAVKSTAAAYGGTLILDATVSAGNYAVLNHSLPKTREWTLKVTNAGLGSTFTNLMKGDQVTSAQLNSKELTAGTYTLYAADATNGITETRKIVVSGRDSSVLVSTSTTGAISSITGLTSAGEKVVVTETTAAGLVVTEYAVNNAANKITRTKTDANGVKTVAELSTFDANTDVTSATFGTPTSTTVTADFDWTTNKNLTGYFAVKNGAATAASGKSTITDKQAGTNYIAVTISADGVVESVAQQAYDAEAGMTTTGAFAGTLNIKAPTTVRLSFDRGTAFANIDESTQVAVTGAITGSSITGLAAGDKVTTASLKAATATAIAQYVTVNEGTYWAGANGALGFLVQNVGNYGDKATLTSGTAVISSDVDAEGVSYLYAGTNVITSTNGSITVKASTNSSGTSYTIGDLGEAETFTVENTATGITYTYKKSGAALLRTYSDDAGDPVNEIYAIGSGKTVTSAIMNNSSNWKPALATFTEQSTGELKSNYGTVTSNLSLVSSRVTTDTKGMTNANIVTKYTTLVGTPDYALVADTYTSSAKSTNTKTLTAELVSWTSYAAQLANPWQTLIGSIDVAAAINAATNKIGYTYAYTANTKIAQAINVVKDWIRVTGSDFADTVKGASSGETYIEAGKGDDTITAGGAQETFYFDLSAADANGRDVLSGYASGKDNILTNGDFDFYLDTASGGNVYIYGNTDGEEGFTAGDEAVQLKAVAGKAVKINGSTFYFGNGTLARNASKTTAGATFNYEEGAYYIGNDSGKNTLKVTTDKKKASKNTLGDVVTVDLTATDNEGHNYYTNIAAVNAASSANEVKLVASSTGSSLVGGSYQSTLVGGNADDTLQGGGGQDVFWFDTISGQDTVKSYTAGKDAIYLNGTTDLTGSISASGSNVVITSGNNAVTVSGAVNAAKAVSISTDGKVNNGKSGSESNVVNYYVGNSSKANNFTVWDENAYYIGGSGTDTLKISGKKSERVTVDMTGSKYQSVDVVDATGITKTNNNVSDANVGVDFKAGASEVTFKGSKFADVITAGDKTTISYANVAQANKDAISNFGVDDIIQISGLKDASIRLTDSATNTYTVTANNLSMTVSLTAGTELKKETGSNSVKLYSQEV